jgi:ferredoxin-NADP reductase
MCKVRVTAGQVKPHHAHRLPAVRTGKGPGLCAGLRPHGRQQRADAGNAGSRRPGRHPGAGDRHHRARAAPAGPRHPAAAPADTAQPPPALPGRVSRSRWPRRRRKRHAQHPIASCPCDDRNLQFFIPRDTEDPLAEQPVCRRVKPGDAISVRGPVGEFVLADSPHPLVFAACDTGFAPIKSLIEHALSLDAAPSITLFWLATRPDGHFMANQCRAWSEALDPFEYSLSNHSDVATGASQMATAIRADLFDIDCAFYIAGPAAFVQDAARRSGRCRRAGSRKCTGRRWHELRLQGRPEPGRPLKTAAAAAANPSRCACWAIRWRPSSTTATSSSSSPTARCTTAAMCWRRWMVSTTSASCWRKGRWLGAARLNPAAERGCADLPLADLRPCVAWSSRRPCPGAAKLSKSYLPARIHADGLLRLRRAAFCAA